MCDTCKQAAKDDFVLPLDKAKVMRNGSDVTIVTFSRMVGVCLQVRLKHIRVCIHTSMYTHKKEWSTYKHIIVCIHTHTHIQAAEKLAQEGIQAEVINMRSIRPIDVKTIADSVCTLVCVCV